MPCVYLLAIDPPYQGKSHYVGYSKHTTPHQRLAQHKRNKNGKTFTGRVQNDGSKLSLIMFWSGPGADEVFERFIKDDRDKRAWCPHCGINSRHVPTLADRPLRTKTELKQMMIARKAERLGKTELELDRKMAETLGYHWG